MKLSLFSVQDHYPDGARTVPQFYKQVIDQAVLAEKLGSAAFFSAEHRFHPYGVVPKSHRFALRDCPTHDTHQTRNANLDPYVSQSENGGRDFCDGGYP